MKKEKDPEVLGEGNYREVAKRAIQKYADKGMLVDCLLWVSIIGHYEKELAFMRAEKASHCGSILDEGNGRYDCCLPAGHAGDHVNSCRCAFWRNDAS